MYRDPSFAAPLSSRPPQSSVRPLRVGMIGIGTVGAGTFRVLARNQALIAGRAGRGIEVVVVAARNLARAVALSYYESRERLGFPMAPREWVEQMVKKAA